MQTFNIQIDGSISYESATEPYVYFNGSLDSFKWRQRRHEPYFRTFGLCSVENSRHSSASQILRAAEAELRRRPDLRFPTLQEILAFDRQYPDEQFSAGIIVPGLYAIGMFYIMTPIARKREGRCVMSWYEVIQQAPFPDDVRIMFVQKVELELGEGSFEALCNGLQATDLSLDSIPSR